jgi:hypothetical protein
MSGQGNLAKVVRKEGGIRKWWQKYVSSVPMCHWCWRLWLAEQWSMRRAGNKGDADVLLEG